MERAAKVFTIRVGTTNIHVASSITELRMIYTTEMLPSASVTAKPSLLYRVAPQKKFPKTKYCGKYCHMLGSMLSPSENQVCNRQRVNVVCTVHLCDMTSIY